MEVANLLSDVWLTKVDVCYWLHVKASDEAIASVNLSAEGEPFRETFEKWAEEQMRTRLQKNSSN